MRRLFRAVFRGWTSLILWPYPADLRAEFGAEIRETLTMRLRGARDRGPGPAVSLLLRESFDSVRSGLRARVRSAGRDATPPFRSPRHPEQSPAERLSSMIDALLQDLRYATRTLVKTPLFSITAIVVLALGIGANTAIFSLVNAVILRPLPFAEPERLLSIWEKNPERDWHQAQVAAANYVDWNERARTFQDMAAHQDWVNDVALTGDGDPIMLETVSVTGNFFDVLGIEMLHGVGFEESDTWSGGEPKLVLSFPFWRNRFGADPGVIGRRLTLDGVDLTVVGVAPPALEYPWSDIDAWTPLAWEPERMTQVSFRRAHGMRVVGRLAPEATAAEAEAELAAIAAALEQEYPETNTQMGTGVTPLHEWIVGETRQPLLVLLSAVGFVLLIACANVANMQLARSAGRRREMVVRSAVGAGAGRLVRQGLTESLLLALVGGAAGLAVGALGIRLVVALSPADLPRLATVGLDVTVVLFALAVSLLTAVAFGALPALRAARPDLQRGLSAARSGLDPQGRRAGRLMVAAEVALALPLIIGAGLMVRSLTYLGGVHPGFVAADTLAIGVSLPSSRYDSGEAVAGFYRQLLDRVQARPGVVSASFGTRVPYRNQRWSSDFTIDGWPADRYGVGIRHDQVNVEFFETLRIPIVRGRAFDEADVDTGLVAVINQALADRYFPDEDPVGRQLCRSRDPEDCNFWFEIVGVAGNVRRESLAVEEVPSVYALITQDPSRGATLYVRTERDPLALLPAIRSEFAALDPALPLSTIDLLEDIVTEATTRERFLLDLLGAFSVIALVLAAVGVYGVTANTTARRTREIGIRMTLGARRGTVLTNVLRGGLAPVAAGVAVGAAAAAGLARVLESYLFGVGSFDAVTYAAVATVLLGVAAVACYLPARRASGVDPVVALRSE